MVEDEGDVLDFPDPSTLVFNNLEVSWSTYLLLESTKSGMGGWTSPPFSGGWLEQPDWMLQDLLLLKYLTRIAENQKKASGADKS